MGLEAAQGFFESHLIFSFTIAPFYIHSANSANSDNSDNSDNIDNSDNTANSKNSASRAPFCMHWPFSRLIFSLAGRDNTTLFIQQIVSVEILVSSDELMGVHICVYVVEQTVMR